MHRMSKRTNFGFFVWQLSVMAVVQDGSYPVWQLSGMAVVQYGSCPYGSCPYGSCPYGSCPRAEKLTYIIEIQYFKDPMKAILVIL